MAFLCAILCVITHTTQKLKVVNGRFIYQTIAVQSEISILLVRAVCELQVVVELCISKKKEESLRGTKLKYLHSIFSTVRRINGTLGVHFTLQ